MPIDISKYPPVEPESGPIVTVRDRAFHGGCNGCTDPVYNSVRYDPKDWELRKDLVTEVSLRSSLFRLCARCAESLKKQL